MYVLFLSAVLALMAVVGSSWGGGLSVVFTPHTLSYYSALSLPTTPALFSLVALTVCGSVLIYSAWYMSGELDSQRFILVVLVFVSSMVLLISSDSVMIILCGWDGLGLSSYFLVVHFSNYHSSGSGLITVLSNRVGDVFIILALLTVTATHALALTSLSWATIQTPSYLALLVISAAITKSALYPYSAWLPEAMAAPTPVSALVHSSTLVTAGVYLLVRFYEVIPNPLLQGLGGLAGFTLLVATLSSLGCMDFKKIIALSTLSQLSFMTLILTLGGVVGTMLHLFTHALFKSCLFMAAGWYMHVSAASQEYRSTKGVSMSSSSVLNVSLPLLAMAGVPMTSGFVSKEVILLKGVSDGSCWLGAVVLLLGAMGTLLYSVRLLSVLIRGATLSSFSSSTDTLVSMSVAPLLACSLAAGSCLGDSYASIVHGQGVSYLGFILKALMLTAWGLAVSTAVHVPTSSGYQPHEWTPQRLLPALTQATATVSHHKGDKQWLELLGPQAMKVSSVVTAVLVSMAPPAKYLMVMYSVVGVVLYTLVVI